MLECWSASGLCIALTRRRKRGPRAALWPCWPKSADCRNARACMCGPRRFLADGGRSVSAKSGATNVRRGPLRRPDLTTPGLSTSWDGEMDNPRCRRRLPSPELAGCLTWEALKEKAKRYPDLRPCWFQSTRPRGARRIAEQTVSELVPVVQTVPFQNEYIMNRDMRKVTFKNRAGPTYLLLTINQRNILSNGYSALLVNINFCFGASGKPEFHSKFPPFGMLS